MQQREQRWPEWTAVLAHWRRFNVPIVDIISFQMEVHHANFPWFLKAERRQSFAMSNPLHGTAYHLCCHISRADEEFSAAYKLYAYCREQRLSAFSTNVLAPVFEKHGSALYEWWSGNARNVLPPIGVSVEEVDRPSDPRQWKSIVKAAASTWIELARTWAVIRIPEWMDRDSPDRATYEKVREAEFEERERREYLRLKAKFEGSGS